MPAKRILVVDDNAIVRSLVRKLFQSQPDFEISAEAENGRDALDKAEKLKPDLIILDLVMPVMTGLDAAPLLLSGSGLRGAALPLTQSALPGPRRARSSYARLCPRRRAPLRPPPHR